MLGVLVLVGCASRPAVDIAECASKGGEVRDVGLFATPACVIPYADAGNVCSDKSDCLGKCKAAPGAVAGDYATGTCQRDNQDTFGCDNEVREGVVVGGMCFD